MEHGPSIPPVFWVIVIIAVVLVALLFARGRKMVGGAEEPSHILLPAGKGPHTHLADLSPGGGGISTEDRGHRHTVVDFVDVGLATPEGVAPADHVHDVTQYIVDRV